MQPEAQRILNMALQKLFAGDAPLKVTVLQKLWSGYGEIARYWVPDQNTNVIVKVVNPANEASHPRGWNTSTSHQRKLSSYQNEMVFYQRFAAMTDAYCRVPACLGSDSQSEMSWLVMEDLDQAGFDYRCDDAPMPLIEQGIRWLAYFHARFLQTNTQSLWPVGTYWHLSTRPDEWHKMRTGPLKDKAQAIDERLNQCQFQTLVHGDAKLANFCFDLEEHDLAAVDFQYVGGGCGIKDVVYFLGSCLDDDGLHQHAASLLDEYFVHLKQAIIHYGATVDFYALESQWRDLYSFAWADFERFLLGWATEHYKLNSYSKAQTNIALTAF